MQPAPIKVQMVFDNYDNQLMVLNATSPGYDYKYDIGEKDEEYSSDSLHMRFKKVEIRLHEKMPPEKVIADIKFVDGLGSVAEFNDVDLLRLIPKLDVEGDMAYPEMLLEEFDRFGYTFRKEHGEFDLILSDKVDEERKAKAERVYRASITNNCLSSTKWEFAMVSEDYSDFEDRKCSDNNLNQNRTYAHSWFRIDPELYFVLLKIKNPGLKKNFAMPYGELSDKAETVYMDFEKLRNPIKRKLDTEVIEVGHQSNRLIEPLDREEYYKNDFGLWITGSDTLTYSSILNQPVSTTQFLKDGFYSDVNLKTFDPGWMRYLDQVDVEIIDLKGTDAYVQFTVTGEYSPYKVVLGNVDLSQLSEQKLRGYLFGINTYPTGRRYNPTQSTIFHDVDLLPKDRLPYLLMVDSKTGNWVNNQYKGVEKIYLTYSSREQDVIDIYLISYERIVPLWMASVKLPKDMREIVRVRKQLYNY